MEKIDVPENILVTGKGFELASVVIHAGSSAEYGHYYTVARSANRQWLILNDSDVTVLSHPIEAFLSTNLCGQDTPYILLYSERSENETLVEVPQKFK